MDNNKDATSNKTKICSNCEEIKSLDDYPTQGNQCCDCMREYHREYRARPEVKDRVARHYPSFHRRAYARVYGQNKKAQEHGLPHTLTIEQWQHSLNYFGGRCVACGRQLGDLFGFYRESIDHWLPITYKGSDNPGTTAKNVIPLCHGIGVCCNTSKGNKMPGVWLERKFGKRKAKQIAERVQTYFDSLEE